MKSNFTTLKNMIISGVNNLYNFYPQIDKLNVFPVPDGDTGTNMNLTCTNGLNEIIAIDDGKLSDLMSAFSRGLIMGARGNSGVIFSQIIKGISIGINEIDEVLTLDNLKNIFKYAREYAYKAVMQPIEGTILTVIREISEHVMEFREVENNLDFKKFIDEVCVVANKSLENTPNLLPVLKEVGVVDSGGFGLVKFFEGVKTYISTKKIVVKLKKLDENLGGNIDLKIDEHSDYGYCTETIVILDEEQKNQLKIESIRTTLQGYGNNSIVAVLDDDILKIHTHALLPGQVLTYLQQFGSFFTVKVENMTLQSDRQIASGNSKIKNKNIIAQKKERKLVNQFASIAVARSTQMAEYFKNELNIDYVINGGEKMNPSIKDFLNAIEIVDAKQVYIFPNDSNIFLAAHQAKKEEKKSKIYIIESKTVCEGMAAFLNLDPDETPKYNVSTLSKIIKDVTTFSITKAARNSTLDGINVKEGEYFCIVNKKITYSASKISDIFKKSLSKFITGKTEIITIFTGKDAEYGDIVLLRKMLDENYDVEFEIVESQHAIYPFIIGIE